MAKATSTSARRAQHIERHGGGGALGDIILGGQDGLVNVLGVILGVAAATPEPRIIVAGGLAATFAESISMAAVAYTSTLADRDFYLAELERERWEIQNLPDAERQEIRDIYADWGLQGDALEAVVDQITANEETWLKVMMADELKLQPVDAESALRSALVVGLAAIVGSIIPLLPFFFLASGLLSHAVAIGVSIVISAIALFVVGITKARLTVGHPGRSGLQMTIIGIASALVGFGIGKLFGG